MVRRFVGVEEYILAYLIYSPYIFLEILRNIINPFRIFKAPNRKINAGSPEHKPTYILSK
jgi:hypothetical protein